MPEWICWRLLSLLGGSCVGAMLDPPVPVCLKPGGGWLCWHLRAVPKLYGGSAKDVGFHVIWGCPPASRAVFLLLVP